MPSCARDVLQAVVPGDAAAELELRLAGRQIELVVHDQDLVGLDREEARERRTALPDAFMNVVGLHDAQRRPALRARRRRTCASCATRRRASRAKRVDEPEAGVVARALVLAARIAEARRPAGSEVAIGRQSALAKRLAAAAAPASPAARRSGYFFLSSFLPSFLSPPFASPPSRRGLRVGARAARRGRRRLRPARGFLGLGDDLRHDGRRDHRVLAAASTTRRRPSGSFSVRHVQRVADRRASDRSTSMNSGRSFGRHAMSSSVITWLTIAPLHLHGRRLLAR